jgi:hypothetical protein
MGVKFHIAYLLGEIGFVSDSRVASVFFFGSLQIVSELPRYHLTWL